MSIKRYPIASRPLPCVPCVSGTVSWPRREPLVYSQTLSHSSSTLKTPRPSNQNHNQTTHNQHPRNPTHQHYTPTTRWKLAPNYIVLCLKISMKPNTQHHNTNRYKCRAERLAQMAQRSLWIDGSRRRRRMVRRQRRVEPEELCDCDANGGKGERCT
jgi:hypothetical protein